MIPPRFAPPGILQLYEVINGERTLIQELPTTSKNRHRINQIRNDLLMVNPANTYILTENNALQ